jgi:membrane protein insertase Oxa1/YidC/SpoIIIJ
METLSIILYPLVLILGLLLNVLVSFFSNNPLIVLLLFSTLISLILRPIQKPLRKIEENTTKTIQLIEDDYRELSKGMNGEQKFHLRDNLYKKYSYNPFYSIKQAISFFALIPFLISVIIIFNDSAYIQNSNLFGIALNSPDGLFFGYNILPIIMFLSTYLDSRFRYANDKVLMNRFMVISIILFFLVYTLPSALIIFWICMNFINMTIFHFKNEN